jgi:hypothetical protein
MRYVLIRTIPSYLLETGEKGQAYDSVSYN